MAFEATQRCGRDDRPRGARWAGSKSGRQRRFRLLTRPPRSLVLLILGGVDRLAGHRRRCRPFETFGFGFLVTEAWNPVTENFGALPRFTARWSPR